MTKTENEQDNQDICPKCGKDRKKFMICFKDADTEKAKELLPKEKKEPTNYSTDPVIITLGDEIEFVGPDPYMLGGIPDKGAMSHTESDYKHFEELTGIPEERVKVYEQHYKGESSEPQEKEHPFSWDGKRHHNTPVESQEELMKELIKAVKDRESAIYWSDFYENEADFINSQLKKFSITRLTP